MNRHLAILWFRQDLRLSDNPALTHAAKHENFLPIYILDNENPGEYGMGAASRWWLHYSLKSLNSSLKGNLSIYKGNPINILMDIASRHNVKAIYWNRCYEPWRMHRDIEIKKQLLANSIDVKSDNGSLLWEPWTIKKNDNSPYKVFTPFYRRGCLKATPPRAPLPKPKNMQCLHDKKGSLDIEQLKLLPSIRWDKQLEQYWKIGETGAHKQFKIFLEKGLSRYKEGRDTPSKNYTSKLSAHLHFGEISPNQLWYAMDHQASDQNIDLFCSELGWREFSYSQLYHHPNLPKKNLQSKFDVFPWLDDKAALKAWKKGQTGVPMVDAGMRELWQTGYMHNRVRMITGSFLVKNLRLHWTHGERWFWDTLVDADLASNSASWQWIAGCGADAAPYFRIFNPVTQGEKFDPKGEYIRRFVPEIASLPNKYLFSPWMAPQDILDEANIQLGNTYPKPIVDLKLSREAALKSFQSLKNQNP